MRKARQVDIKRAIDTDIYTSVKAVKDGQIVGYVSWRQGNYIAQLYVSSKYQKKGIGRELVSEMLRRSGSLSIELKASVNAVSFYKRLGFKPTDKEQVKDGIRYLPMLFISDE
jgi:predicted N-acetyltransferase YhbS